MSVIKAEEFVRKAGSGKWLLLPIENKSREFDAKLFLGCLAAEKGYKVLLGHYSDFRSWLRCLPRGVILEKCISIHKEEMMKRLIESGYRICVSDEEGLSVFKDPDAYVRTRINKATLSLAERVFSWSDGEAKVVRDAFPEYADKVVVTGTPRVDLWRPELRGMYADQVARLHERFGRYILLPSNFSSVIFVRGSEAIIEKAKKYGYLRDGIDEQVLREKIQHDAVNLDAFVSSFVRIREEFPGHALIIRPHPTDDHRYWQDAIKDIDNAYVVYEGGVTPWLLGADAIFHHGCTTGIESRILGRCAVGYHPVWDERFDKHPSTAVGPVVKEEDGLMRFIRDAIASMGSCDLREGEVDAYIQATYGPFASERILDALDMQDWQKDAMNLTWSNPKAARVRLHERVRRIRRWVRRPFIKGTEKYRIKQSRTRQKWPGASVSEIVSLIAGFNSLTGRFKNVAAKRVSKDIFYLSID